MVELVWALRVLVMAHSPIIQGPRFEIDCSPKPRSELTAARRGRFHPASIKSYNGFSYFDPVVDGERGGRVWAARAASDTGLNRG